jgi:multiple antibiotic resistance protein
MIGPAEIFSLLFVTLGPLKILGPFAQHTRDLDDRTLRKTAMSAFGIATASIVVGSLLGAVLARSWHLSSGSLLLAAGLIFLLVALRQLLEQYEPPHAAAQSQSVSPLVGAVQLVFPIVLTPYGIASAIVLLVGSDEAQRMGLIIALLVAVMVLNLLAMLFVRKILVGVMMVVLRVLGAVLGVLQAGPAIEFLVRGCRLLGVING